MYGIPFDPSKLILVMKATLGALTVMAMVACGACSVMHPTGF